VTLIRRIGGWLDPAIILSVPPLVGVALVALYLTVESVRPGTLTQPRPETIPEAIALGNGPRALEMMAEGFDIDAPARIRAGVLDHVEYEVTPLEAALMMQRMEVVRLLVRTGVDVSRSTRAPCLARERLPEALPLLGVSPAGEPAGAGADCFAGPGS
jgi:hypothetical protein